jgi:tetratricopeptide (TPR) repeat protein
VASLFRKTELALVLLLALACQRSDDPLREIRALQEQERFEESVEPLRRLLDRDPSLNEGNLLLGTALLRSGQPGLAIWPLGRAAETEEHAVEAGLMLTRAMLDSRSAPDAVVAIDRVLALEPANPDALTLRAEAYLATSRLQDARVDIERVLELDPDNLAVLVPRVILLIGMGEIEEAETALESAREAFERADPELPETMRARLCVASGLFAFEKGYLETAESQYAECLEAFPTDPLAVTETVAHYQRTGRGEEATEILRRAYESSGSTFFRFALAQRLGMLGDAEEQERLLREEAELRPSWLAWFTVADFYVRREAWDEAIEAFENARTTSRSPSAKLLFAYADTLIQAERYDRAREIAQQIEPPELHQLIRGRLLLAEGDPSGSLEAFEAGIKLWPNNPGGRFFAGQAAERLGRFDRASSHYRESLRAGPAQSEAGLALAGLYEARGDLDGALDAIGRYVRTHPNDPQGYLLAIRIAHRSERFDLAAEGLERLGQLPGQASVAVSEEARLVSERRGAAGAVEVIERSQLDLAEPANAAALRLLMTQLAALEDHGKADGLVHAALEAHPESAVFHELQGSVLRAAGGDPSLSLAAYDRALELDPTDARSLVGLAELTAESGDLEGALVLYDRASEADPEDPTPARAAAQLLFDAQQTDRAQERLERLLGLHPREAGAALDLARIHAERGELDRALALAERAAWFREPGSEEAVARIRGLRAEPERTAEAVAPE